MYNRKVILFYKVCKKLFTRTSVCDIVKAMIEGDNMQVLKGYVFRMYPTKEQQELINKTIGCSRFIYNHFLDDKIKEYKKLEKVNQLMTKLN